MFTKTTRERPPSSARCQCRIVCTSTPMTGLTTKTAPSTTRKAAIASPWKPASPGVSIRLIFRPCHSTCSTEADSDIWRRCSSSSQSLTVEPPSTVPSRFVAPAWNRSASTREVFPVPRCPTTATLRILPGSTGMRWLLLTRLSGDRTSLAEPRGSEVSAMSGSGARSGFERRARGGAGQTRLQAQDRLRVELRDAGLRDPEDLADLAQGQLLVVVEGDHELLTLREARDGLADRLLHLGLGQRALRVGRIDVLDRVDHRDRVAAPGVHGPELVERRDRGAGDVGERLVQLVDREAELLGDLLVGRSAMDLPLELGDRALDVARPGTHGPRHPVHRPELVDDRTFDPRNRVRLELDVTLGVVALDRSDQAEQPVGDEVTLVDVCGQPGPEAAGHVLDERRIGEDQAIPKRFVVFARAELPPKRLGVFGLGHAQRIRGVSAYLKARRASEASQIASAAAASATIQRPASPPAPWLAANARPAKASASREKSAPMTGRCLMRTSFANQRFARPAPLRGP